MKKLLIAALVLAMLYAVAASPFSIVNAVDEYKKLDTQMHKYQNQRRSYEDCITLLNNSKAKFDKERSFEIYYGDIERIQQLLENVSIVSIMSISAVDVADYNRETAYVSGSNPSGIKMVLAATDLEAGLNVISRLELPILSLMAQQPNIIEVVFLTGGSLQ